MQWNKRETISSFFEKKIALRMPLKARENVAIARKRQRVRGLIEKFFSGFLMISADEGFLGQ